MRDFERLVGERIVELRGSKDRLVFVTPKDMFEFLAEGDCCSSSWFEHVTGLKFLLGQRVVSAEEVAMDQPPQEDYECLQSYGYKITTEAGVFEVEMRNESNGYYGGYITVSEASGLPTDYPLIEEDF